MKVQEAIMAFSQSEKIKSGLIWVSQALELLRDMPEPERHGGEKAIKVIIEMLIHEIHLAKKVAGDVSWGDIDRHIDQALVMINSGVAPESVTDLTRALTQATNVGQRSMSFLKEQGLL